MWEDRSSSSRCRYCCTDADGRSERPTPVPRASRQGRLAPHPFSFIYHTKSLLLNGTRQIKAPFDDWLSFTFFFFIHRDHRLQILQTTNRHGKLSLQRRYKPWERVLFAFQRDPPRLDEQRCLYIHYYVVYTPFPMFTSSFFFPSFLFTGIIIWSNWQNFSLTLSKSLRYFGDDISLVPDLFFSSFVHSSLVFRSNELYPFKMLDEKVMFRSRQTGVHLFMGLIRK